MNDWLMILIIFIGIFNLCGFIMNIKLLSDGEDCTMLYQIWTNDMNLFGRLLLTFICLILFPVWTILEALVRLLKWLCYVGKEKY